MLENLKKKKKRLGVSLQLSVNDSSSHVESSANSLAALEPAAAAVCPAGTLAACPQCHLPSQRSRLSRAGAEGWQQALVLLALPRPMGTESREGGRGDLGNHMEAKSSKSGPEDREERKQEREKSCGSKEER